MNKIYQKIFSAVKNTGFTLVELLVVVLIIGILAAIAVPQYTRAVKKARMVEAITMVRFLRDHQRLFVLANGIRATTFYELGADGFSGGNSITKNDFVYAVRGYYDGNIQALYTKGPKIWIEGYIKDDRIVCTAERGDVEANNFCKQLYGRQEECLDGTAWWAYRIE